MKPDNFEDLELSLIQELARIYPPSQFSELRAQYFQLKQPTRKPKLISKISSLLKI